ncbi:small basic protein [Candidatus Omnitrophota bacterium]
MSIHPSLSSSAKAKKTRSVLKRAERLKILMDKESWKEGQSIFGLAKVKTVRLKIKKEKAAAAPAAGAGEGAAEAAGKTAGGAAAEPKTASAKEKPAKS